MCGQRQRMEPHSTAGSDGAEQDRGGGGGGRSNVTARSPSQSERLERVLTRCVRLGMHAFWRIGNDRQHPPTAGSVCPCALAIAPRGAVALRALRAGCGLVVAAGHCATCVGESEFPWLATKRMRGRPERIIIRSVR